MGEPAGVLASPKSNVVNPVNSTITSPTAGKVSGAVQAVVVLVVTFTQGFASRRNAFWTVKSIWFVMPVWRQLVCPYLKWLAYAGVAKDPLPTAAPRISRSEEHTSEL